MSMKNKLTRVIAFVFPEDHRRCREKKLRYDKIITTEQSKRTNLVINQILSTNIEAEQC